VGKLKIPLLFRRDIVFLRLKYFQRVLGLYFLSLILFLSALLATVLVTLQFFISSYLLFISTFGESQVMLLFFCLRYLSFIMLFSNLIHLMNFFNSFNLKLFSFKLS